MRISLKIDYALRAMAHLAAEPPGQPVKAEHIARVQGVPLKFLLAIFGDLKRARLVRSIRGPIGGFLLRRGAEAISLADVIRAVDGPLANVHDTGIEDLTYVGAAEPLREVWMAVRASLRSVLETVSLADLASGSLPEAVKARAAEYEAWAAKVNWFGRPGGSAPEGEVGRARSGNHS